MGHIIVGTEIQPVSVKLDSFPRVVCRLPLLEIAEGSVTILPLLPLSFYHRFQLFDFLPLFQNLRLLLLDQLLLLAENLGGTGEEKKRKERQRQKEREKAGPGDKLQFSILSKNLLFDLRGE